MGLAVDIVAKSDWLKVLIVLPSSAILRKVRINFFSILESSPLVGSSSNKISGLFKSSIDPDAAMYYQNKYKKIPLSDIILKKKRKRVEKDNRISMLVTKKKHNAYSKNAD